MKDENLRQILKKIDEVNAYDVEVPDMSGRIKKLASSADLPQKNMNLIRRNKMEIKQSTARRTKIWAWLAPITACLVAGIICLAVILPGLLGDDDINSSGNNITVASSESRYLVKQYQATDSNEYDRIKYSYSYNDENGNEYDFYYVYLGQLQNIPLCYKGQMYHTGQNRTYSFTTTQESMVNIGDSITQGSAEAIGIVREHSESKTTGEKLGTEVGAKVSVEGGAFGAKVSAEASVKVSAETTFESTVNDTTSNSFEKTTSLEKTVSRATSFSQSEQETYEYSLTKEDPNGYYRLSLFSVSDVYLYLIKEADIKDENGNIVQEGEFVYYEFKEHLVPNSLTWGLDYSEDFFKKENDTKFQLNTGILDNLPKPTVHLGGGSKPIDPSSLFENPDSSSLVDINTTSEPVLTVVLTNSTGNNNKVIKIPNNVEVLNIKGVSGHTFTNVRFEVESRTTKLILNLWDFNFIAQSKYNAITCNGDLDLNIIGSCSITGGAGVNSYYGSSDNQGGNIGIKANNLAISGTGSLKVIGGKAGNGLGTGISHAANKTYYWGMYGGLGGIGIECISLVTNITSLTVMGGAGGDGDNGSHNGTGGGGGAGAIGIYCSTSLVNFNLKESIIVYGGDGGNGAKGGPGEDGGKGGDGGKAIQGTVTGLVDAIDGNKGNNGPNG